MNQLDVRLARAAVPVDSAAFGDLISDVVGQRSLACIGESHHFVHETYVLRAQVLQVLARVGFSRAGFEIARTDGVRLDDYLVRGNRAALDRVGTFGYATPFDRPYSGVLAVPDGAYPAIGMRCEYEQLLASLRGCPSTAGPWSVFGFDIDYSPGIAAERLTDVVDRAERARCEATLEVSRRYDHAVRLANTYDELREPMAWRERIMVEHVEFELQRRPQAKTALCGHNLHLGAANPVLEVAGTVGPGGGLAPPLGAALAALGHDAATIWMLHERGVDSGPPPSTGVVNAPKRSLNRRLASVGSWFAIRTDAVEEFGESWPISGIYNTVIEMVPAQQCEVILFAAETTALRTTM